MKPSDKHLESLRVLIADAYARTGASNAEIGRQTGIHPSQVGRICGGSFKTFSHSVVQICRFLEVSVPRVEQRIEEIDPAWAKVQLSMRRIWDETPEGAMAIARLLDAIAELQTGREHDVPLTSEKQD